MWPTFQACRWMCAVERRHVRRRTPGLGRVATTKSANDAGRAVYYLALSNVQVIIGIFIRVSTAFRVSDVMHSAICWRIVLHVAVSLWSLLIWKHNCLAGLHSNLIECTSVSFYAKQAGRCAYLALCLTELMFHAVHS